MSGGFPDDPVSTSFSLTIACTLFRAKYYALEGLKIFHVLEIWWFEPLDLG